MSVKIECDGCGSQVENTPVKINGWWTLSRILHFPTYDDEDPDHVANFCMAACIVLYLQKKGLVPHDRELRET